MFQVEARIRGRSQNNGLCIDAACRSVAARPGVNSACEVLTRYRTTARRTVPALGMLDSKVAIVTGGSRGIGAASALALADEGADVAISCSSSADQAKAVVAGLEARGNAGGFTRDDRLRGRQVGPSRATAGARPATWPTGASRSTSSSPGSTPR